MAMSGTAGTSGQYSFNPSIADLFLEAFGRCEIMAPAITRGHVIQARRSLNFLLVSWSNRGVNLWAVDLQTIVLVAGQAPYPVDPATLTVLDVYYSQIGGGGPGIDTDRLMTPMSRTEYAEIPNKLLPGIPTRYWFEKLAAPIMTLWQPPLLAQAAPTYAVKFFRMRRLQDAQPTMGQQADVHYLALDALAAELAARLSIKYKPEKYGLLSGDATKAWDLFASTNREDTPISIRPNLSGYFR